MVVASETVLETALDSSSPLGGGGVCMTYEGADLEDLDAEDKVVLSYLDAEGYETPVDPEDISVGPEYGSMRYQVGGGAVGYAVSEGMEAAASHPAVQDWAQAAKDALNLASIQYPEATAVFTLAVLGAYGGMRQYRHAYRQQMIEELSGPVETLYNQLREEHQRDPLTTA